MVEMLSPLGPAWQAGHHGDHTSGVGVVMSETRPGSIVQVAAWPGEERALLDAVALAAGLSLDLRPGAGIVSEGKSAFGFAPGRFLLVADDEGLVDSVSQAVPATIGSVTDLSHGRTAIRLAGPKVEWVLAKFFAVDFSLAAFPVSNGISTSHHDIFALIQRTGADQFDLYVYRSFARSFWHALCHASEEVGYEVR
jgi:sarcosine oxidase subunit gamma